MNILQVAALSVALSAAFLMLMPLPPDFEAVEVDSQRSEGFVGVFAPNNKLQKTKHIHVNEVHAPETVFFSPEGVLYTVAAHEGWVMRKESDGKLHKFVYTGGLPLAGEFDSNGHLYVAVGREGLIKINTETKEQTIVLNYVDGRAINFADDLEISNNGKIYFSDASKFGPVYTGHGHYDGIIGSLYESLEGQKTGRIIEYDIATGSAKVILDGLWFANGVALSKDQSYLVVSETFGRNLHRIWLTGPKAGKSEIVAENLPFLIDSISPASDGGFWLAFVNKELSSINSFLDHYPALKTLAARLPPSVLLNTAGVKPYGAVGKADKDGKIVECLQDPEAQSFGGVTSIKEHNGKLYLGSLANSFIGVYDL